MKKGNSQGDKGKKGSGSNKNIKDTNVNVKGQKNSKDDQKKKIKQANFTLLFSALVIYFGISTALFYFIDNSVNASSEAMIYLSNKMFPRQLISLSNYTFIKTPARNTSPLPAPTEIEVINPEQTNHTSLVLHFNNFSWNVIRRAPRFLIVKFSVGQKCSECRDFDSQFDILSHSFSKYPSSFIQFGEISCGSSEDICDQQDIQHLPEIWLYHHQMRTKFSGPLSVNALQNWIADEVYSRGFDKPTPVYVAPSDPLRYTFRALISKERILDLNKDTYGYVKSNTSNTFWVVKYFRENCPHCHKLKPVYQNVSAELAYKSRLKFAQVNCVNYGSVCQDGKVHGVPTVRLFFQGAFVDFKGPRDTESLKRWIRESIEENGIDIVSPPPPSPKSEYVADLNAESFGSIKKRTEFWFIKFYRDNSTLSRRWAPTFIELAQSLQSNADLKFGEVDCIANEDLCSKHKIHGVPKFRLFYKDHSIDYRNNKRDVATLTEWLANSTANDGHLVLHPPHRPKKHAEEEEKERNRDRDRDRESADVGKKNDRVAELDGMTLSALADADTTNFWLVKFYRRKNSKSQRFAPKFDELVEKLKDRANIKFAQLDCAANEEFCNKSYINEVPKLRFYYKNERLSYHGKALDVSTLTQWIINSTANGGDRIFRKKKDSQKKKDGDRDKDKKDRKEKKENNKENKERGGGGGVKSEYVQDLTPSRLTSFASDDSTFWLVNFYRDDNATSQRLAPTYAQLAERLQNRQLGINFGQFDCAAHESFCSEKKIQVPKLRFYYKNRTYSYHRKSLDVSTLTQWVLNTTADGGKKILEQKSRGGKGKGKDKNKDKQANKDL